MKILQTSVLTGALCFNSLFAQSVNEHIENGKTFLEQRDLPAAHSEFEAAVEKSPNNEEANLFLGITHFMSLLEEDAFANLAESFGAENISNDNAFDTTFNLNYYVQSFDTFAQSDGWFFQDYNTYDDEDALESGFIGPLGVSSFNFNLTGPGTLSFYQMNYICDLDAGSFSLLIDGEVVQSFSETFFWSLESQEIPAGTHEIEFRVIAGYTCGDFALVDAFMFNEIGEPNTESTLADAIDLDVDITTSPFIPSQNAELGTAVPIPDEDFQTAEIVSYLQETLLPRLLSIESNFSKITDPNFNITLSNEIVFRQSGSVPVDIGDVHLLRTIVYKFIGFSYLASEYNLDVVLKELTDAEFLDEGFTMQELLAEYPHLFRNNRTGNLPLALEAFTSMAEEYQAASAIIYNRDPEDTHLFNPLVSIPSDADWFHQTNESQDGSDAAQSGPIFDEQKSIMSIEVEGSGLLTFYWKVSSEPFFDTLKFFVNGTLVETISGEVDWTRVAYRFSEDQTHTITWQYSKDYVDSEGVDAGWVDNIQWSNAPETDPSPGSLQDAIELNLPISSDLVQSTVLSQDENSDINDAIDQFMSSPTNTFTFSGHTIEPNVFFEDDFNPRDQLPLFYENNIVSGTLPDSTFSGLLPELSLSQFESEFSASDLFTELDSFEIVSFSFEGWFQSNWFGPLNFENDPWLFHPKIGWVYNTEASADNVWFFHGTLGWIWTTPEYYPYFFGDGDWYRYEQYNGKAFFYNFNQSEWLEVNK